MNRGRGGRRRPRSRGMDVSYNRAWTRFMEQQAQLLAVAEAEGRKKRRIEREKRQLKRFNDMLEELEDEMDRWRAEQARRAREEQQRQEERRESDDDDDDEEPLDAPENGQQQQQQQQQDQGDMPSDDDSDSSGSSLDEEMEHFHIDNFKETEKSADGSYASFLKVARSSKILLVLSEGRFIDLARFHNLWDEVSHLDRMPFPRAIPFDAWQTDEGRLKIMQRWMYQLMHGNHRLGAMTLNTSEEEPTLDFDITDTRNAYFNCFLFVCFFLNERVRDKERDRHGFLFKTLIDEGTDPFADGVVWTRASADNVIDVRRSGLVKANPVIAAAMEMRFIMHSWLEDCKDDYDTEWHDTSSGTTIVIRTYGRNMKLSFALYFGDRNVFPHGACWFREFDELVDNAFPDGGICAVTNDSDYLCLIYTMIMGLIKIARPRYFQFKQRVSPNELDQFVHSGDPNLCIDALDIMRSAIIERRSAIANMIEESVGKSCMSTREARTFFEDIEREFLKDKHNAMDVVAGCVRDNGRCVVFPCYTSRRKTENRMLVCNLTFPNGLAHYVLVTNPRKLYQSEGKIFYSCHTCHNSFYTMSALQKHIVNRECVEEKGKQWHWASVGAQEMNEPGIEEGPPCPRCHLMFDNEFSANHHAKYCFMKNKTGSRYVELLPKEQLCLTGEPVEEDYNAEEGPEYKEIWYADFECSIDKETGEHTFMSYGMYADLGVGNGCAFYIGFDIGEFLDKLHDRATHNHRLNKGKVWVYFHNAMNYDANFILREVLSKEKYKKWCPKMLMKSSSQMQALRFTFRSNDGLCQIIIGDSFRFFSMSLERIVKCMKREGQGYEVNEKVFPAFFHVMTRHFEVSKPAANMILKKNLFPYKFFDSSRRLLTPIEEFRKIFEPKEENLQYFSDIVTVPDLQKNFPDFESVCRVFRVRKAGDYHNIYLACDVLQLADMFTEARGRLYTTHQIDITNYVGLPAATWHAFLRFNLDLRLPLYSATIYAEFFHSMTRGGVTSAPLRYAEADETHSIFYLDFNGLYPYAMSHYLYPDGGFNWYTPHTEDIERHRSINEWLLKEYFPRLEARGRGACLRVDLHIPVERHEYFDQYPPAPTHEILHDCYYNEDGSLYPFLQEWSNANGGAKMPVFRGLVATLDDKKEYGVHWRLLSWYIQHGVEVTKLYHCVEFCESDYLRGYISKNIELRNNVRAGDEYGKMLYKGMNNSLYGKTFEDTFNRGSWIIVRGKERLNGVLEEGNVLQMIPICEDCWFVKLDAEVVVLDKPTYIGACITEYAKLLMYELIYDRLPKAFATRNIELIYTDTDSVIIRVEHTRGMSSDELFEMAERNCPGLIGNLGGQVKSETGHDLIKRVIAIRSKVYAFETMKGETVKHAKGVEKSAQERQLTFDDYLNAIFTHVSIYTRNMQFRRKAGRISTEYVTKLSISVNDGKRLIEEDGIHTHAIGFKKE